MSQHKTNANDRRLSAAKQLLMDLHGTVDILEVSLAYSEDTNQDALFSNSGNILDHSFLSENDDNDNPSVRSAMSALDSKRSALDSKRACTAVLSAEKAPTALPGKMGDQEKTQMEPRRAASNSTTSDTTASDGSIPLQCRTLIEEEDFGSFEREISGRGPNIGSDAILRGNATEPPPLPVSAAARPVVKSMWFSFCCSGGDVDRNDREK